MRIDLWLAENGFAPSRQKAQDLVAKGRVFVGELQIKKPSYLVTSEVAEKIRVRESTESEFVSRGGTKLFGALQKLNLASRLQQASVLDVGISTGGFADCVLRLGAARVVGVDVGHGQLAPSLKNDPRVVLFEGVNARELASHELHEKKAKILEANDDHLFDLIVVDVSFISLRQVLPALVSFLKEKTDIENRSGILALVKPQFEVGRENIGRGGIVKDATLYPKVEASLRDVCASLGLRVESFIDSPILGSDGNREFFIYATVPQLGFF